VYSLDIKRCPHCVGYLAAIRLEDDDEFAARAPAVLCTYCDGLPHWDHALFVPRPWAEPRD
jgi:hypothetical protein